MDTELECGCQTHTIPKNDNNRVILYGKTWHPLCAIKETLHQIAHLKERIISLEKRSNEFDKILKKIQEVQCPYCGREVGNNWEFYEKGISCTQCITEFGEG